MFLTNDNQIKGKKMGVAALLTGVLVACGICWFDEPVLLMMRHLDCPMWKWMQDVFSAKVWLVVSFVAALVFCLKKCVTTDCSILRVTAHKNLWLFCRNFFDKTRKNPAFLIFYSVLAASLVVGVSKVLIGRARPIFFEALDITGFFPPSFDWAFNSMPSGHTAVSFAGLVMIGMLAPRYKFFTWTLAIIIGLSRIAIGAHWPSDVILGAFIGMVVADIIKSMKNKI